MFAQINRIKNKYTQMTIEERLINAKVLRRGDMRLLAEKADVSVGIVHRYINGILKESAVEPYFIALVDKRKKEIANISFD